MEDRIEKRIKIAAPLSRVWTVLTDHSQFGAWFLVKMDGPSVAGKSVGGQITHPGYEHVRMEIKVKELTPETCFSYTWHPYSVDPNTDYSQEEPTLVEFHLEETKGGTLLTFTESGFERIPIHRRAEAFRQNDGGWTQQLHNIEAYVHKTP